MIHSNTQIRVRFAPSPTGHLHIGGLRTALFNWLFARHHNGTYLLRIEDTDAERSTDAFKESIMQSFEWVGIVPDEPVVIQSERTAAHKQMLQKLWQEGKIYPCFCTPEELELRLGRNQNDGQFVAYDRACLGKKVTAAMMQQPFVFRFKIPDVCTIIEFEDIIRGKISIDRAQLDDFIITRSDGNPVYNFVVVIDDAFMRISHIIRGEEHISNTPKQILLYQACGYDIPQFAHLPMILGADGSKLSKRDGAVSVIDYKKNGYLAPALLNYLARLGWSHQNQEIFSIKELIDYFSLEQVGKKGAVFDIQKLNWLNSFYIRQMSGQQLFEAIRELDSNFVSSTSNWQQDQYYTALNLYKERVHTLTELIDELYLLYKGPIEYNAEDCKQWLTPQARIYLKDIAHILHNTNEQASTFLETEIKMYAQQQQIKLATIAQPLRLTLIGKATGPGVFALLPLLNRAELQRRIENILSYTI